MSCACFSTAAQQSCAPGYIFEAVLGVGAVCDRVNKRSETTNFYNLPKKSRTNHISRTRWGRIETLFWQVGILGCEVVRCDDSGVSVLQRRGVKGARASKRLQPAKILGASVHFPILRFRCQVLNPKLQVPNS